MRDWDSKWDHRFLEMAKLVASWSKDPSTKVGAVIVDEDKRVRGVGYNGFPTGVQDIDGRLEDREKKYKFIVHAEQNAILNSDLSTMLYARTGTLYCTMFPCAGCAKVIIQCGAISELITPTGAKLARWDDDHKIADEMLFEANIITREIG